MNVVGIIAKGESSRIPRKNAKDFCGKPLVSWSIRQAKCSHLVDRVVVSTDDPEIEEIASEYGAIVIRRPPEVSKMQGGYAFKHIIESVKEGLVPSIPKIDEFIGVMPTSPVRLPWDMDFLTWQRRRTNVGHVMALCRQLETILYRRRDQSRDEADLSVYDKRGTFFVDGGGMHVSDADWYLNEIKYRPAYDGEIDDGDPFLVDPNKMKIHQHVYELCEWQTPELDMPEHWGQAEAIMKHCILDRYGEKCYEEYADKMAEPWESVLEIVGLGADEIMIIEEEIKGWTEN